MAQVHYGLASTELDKGHMYKIGKAYTDQKYGILITINIHHFLYIYGTVRSKSQIKRYTVINIRPIKINLMATEIHWSISVAYIKSFLATILKVIDSISILIHIICIIWWPIISENFTFKNKKVYFLFTRTNPAQKVRAGTKVSRVFNRINFIFEN